MTVRTMVDSTHYVPPPFAAVTVAAFYLPGNGASRGWPKNEVDSARHSFVGLLPIQVAYNSFATPVADARRALQQLNVLGIDRGAVAIDIEENVANKAMGVDYVGKWSAEMNAHGRYSLGYTSRSTVAAIRHANGLWVANPGQATLVYEQAHQYAFPGAYDLSVIDDAQVPIWGVDTSHPIPPIVEGEFMLAFDPLSGGYWGIDTATGAVYAQHGAPYLGGANTHPEWDIAHVGKIVGMVAWPGNHTDAGGNGYSIVVHTANASAPFVSYDFPGDGRYR